MRLFEKGDQSFKKIVLTGLLPSMIAFLVEFVDFLGQISDAKLGNN
jgi:sorbitol-specific phosphotransferase system component IIC